MSVVTISDRWGVRGGTAADLAAVNEIPLIQEMIVETDTRKLKLGDGVTHYNSLTYFNTDSCPEGSTNLYFTNERAQDALAAAFAAGTQTGITISHNSDGSFDFTVTGGGGGSWGSITGTLAAQADLQAALDAKLDDSQVDTDTTLAANSDAKIPSQKAVKAYVDSSVAGLLDLKGGTAAAANPNYPAALKGDAYYVTSAGKIGGASGKSVDVGDVFVASADNAGGTEASVGASWFVLEHNLLGALIASNNLSDLTNAGTARTNLGLGTLATQSGTFSGTSSGTNTGDLDAVTALSIASGVVNIDCAAGAYYTLSLTANVTSLTFSNLPASGHATTLMIRMKQDATGSRTFALPSSFKRTAGSDSAIQSAANAYTILAITTFDQGTRWEYTMAAGSA